MAKNDVARWVSRLAVGAAFLGCSAKTQSSSSSSWIGCNEDVDCNSVPGAVACQAGWCVDCQGQRVASQPEVLVTKLDLLFMIDDSASMADKQAVLRNTVPDLLNRFVNPVCVDSSGNTTG